MDGVDYDERLERIAEVTYPKPLEDLLDAAFGKYCDAVPWARDYCLRPKSVLRDMLESAADFKGYIQKLGIMRYEAFYFATCPRHSAALTAPFPRTSAPSS